MSNSNHSHRNPKSTSKSHYEAKPEPSKLKDSQKRTPREVDFRMKFKTEICRNWENGSCEYGDKCAFAHGTRELRNKTLLASNYKTKKCKHFFEFGYCVYGNRCQFSHTGADTQTSTPSTSKLPSRPSSSEGSHRLPIFQELEFRNRV